MNKVDARGLSCPEPVVMTMNQVNKGDTEFQVLVDAKVCVENIKRYAATVGYDVDTKEVGSEWELTLKKKK